MPHFKHENVPRKRRPLSFYEARAKKRGFTNLVDAVEITANDASRGWEMM
jgi:hypothetical protein